MANSRKRQRVVIVGAGFAGFNAARELSRIDASATEIVAINSTDYFLYLPLMPQVAGGLLEPRHIRVALARRLRTAQFVLGMVNHVDPHQKVVSWLGPEGSSGQVGYDRLILTAGSVNKLLPIPGMRGLRPADNRCESPDPVADLVRRRPRRSAGRRHQPRHEPRPASGRRSARSPSHST